MSFFPVKHEKFPLSYIQDAKNFSAVKSLNSGEAVASPASPVPPPLHIAIYYYDGAICNSNPPKDLNSVVMDLLYTTKAELI